jgi:hypothetical protein
MTQYVKNFFFRYKVLLAFALVILVALYAVGQDSKRRANQLYTSQLQGCERVNKLRKESNLRIRAHDEDRDVLSQFLGAAEARRRKGVLPGDLKTADTYEKLRETLKSQVTFRPISIVSCNKAVKRP